VWFQGGAACGFQLPVQKSDEEAEQEVEGLERENRKMSFICQKCGTRDYPCWRNHRWTMYATYCKLDDLETWQPELISELKEKKQIERYGYFYNLAKNGYIVIRIPADLKDFWKRGHTEENATRARERALQKKLEVFG